MRCIDNYIPSREYFRVQYPKSCSIWIELQICREFQYGLYDSSRVRDKTSLGSLVTHQQYDNKTITHYYNVLSVLVCLSQSHGIFFFQTKPHCNEFDCVYCIHKPDFINLNKFDMSVVYSHISLVSANRFAQSLHWCLHSIVEHFNSKFLEALWKSTCQTSGNQIQKFSVFGNICALQQFNQILIMVISSVRSLKFRII